MTPLHRTLTELLATLRAIQWHAWTTHWKTSGPEFYGDHLLYQRIYEGSGGGPDIAAQTDGLGERIVALYSPKGMDAVAVQSRTLEVLKGISGKTPVEGALCLEMCALKLGAAAAGLTSKLPPQYSVNLDNFLRSLVDERSTVVYLLQQRMGTSPTEFGDVSEMAARPGRNLDYPVPLGGSMAKNYLSQLEQDARALRLSLEDRDTLPGWVNAYIFTSADRLQTASRYMDRRIAAFQPSEYSGPATDALEVAVNSPLVIATGLAFNLVLFGTAGAVLAALLPVVTVKQGWAVGSVVAIGRSALGQYKARKAIATARAAGF